MSATAQIRELLEKKFKDSAELFPDFTVIKQIPVIKTSSAILNMIMGVGGFPQGRVIEIFGPESTGKTTIAIEAAIAAQKRSQELAVLFLDFEHAFDAAYAHGLGLNLDPKKFIICQPDTFEQGESICREFLVDEKKGIEKNLLSLIVIDSAAAMTPKQELMGEPDDITIGLQARLMARFLGRAKVWITKGTKPPLVTLNQTRTKIDIKNPANNGEQAAGGKALKFYSSIRIMLEATRGEGEEDRSKTPGFGTDQVFKRHRVRATCVKNKVAPPWMRGNLVFDFGTGINNLVSVAEMAEKKLGIMSGAGFFNYQGDSAATSFKCRGREEFLAKLQGDKQTADEIEKKLMAAIRTEHAKTLGLKEIKEGGAAKEIEGEVLLDEVPENGELRVEETE